MKRHDKRRADEIRPISITYDIYEYAAGSVLFEVGKTKLLCAVTLQTSVPHFLRGQGVSWLMAEYALLPAATQIRTAREASVMRRSGRSVEISRLISRVLRTVIDETVLGESTIVVDCDVLQADGGTRTVAITAASLALMVAQERWLARGIISRPLMKDGVGAVSIGVFDGEQLVVDPDYHEDSSCIADMNIIMTHSGKLIEVHGGAEKGPIAWETMLKAGELAQGALQEIAASIAQSRSSSASQLKEKTPLFSLKSRQQQFSE